MRFWKRRPKHGEAGYDGTHLTCICGYNNSADWNLAIHFERVGLVE